MEKKFNLYDLLGFGIPGAIFLFIIYGIGRELELVPVIDGTIATSFGFLAISYVLGHVILHFAKLQNPAKYHLSKKLLNDEDKNLPKHLKDAIKKAVADKLKIDFSRCKSDKDREEVNQTIFDLCYTCVIQQEKGFYTENFNALYGMCRSMGCLTYFALFYTVLIFYNRFAPGSFWGMLFIVLATWFWLYVQDIFVKAWKGYAESFALSVYKAFYCSIRAEEKVET